MTSALLGPVRVVERRPIFKQILEFFGLCSLLTLLGGIIWLRGIEHGIEVDAAKYHPVHVIIDSSVCKGVLSRDSPTHATCWVLALEPQSKKRPPIAYYAKPQLYKDRSHARNHRKTHHRHQSNTGA